MYHCTHTIESWHAHEWVISHIRRSSCRNLHVYEWVMAHTDTNTHIDIDVDIHIHTHLPTKELLQKPACVWMSHGSHRHRHTHIRTNTHPHTHTHTHEGVLEEINRTKELLQKLIACMGHGTRMNESWHTFVTVLSHIRGSYCRHDRIQSPGEEVVARAWMSHGTHTHTHAQIHTHTHTRSPSLSGKRPLKPHSHT